MKTFREVYDAAQALSDPWHTSDYDKDPAWEHDPEAAKVAIAHHGNRRAFIPTGFATLDSAIKASGVKVVYNRAEEPRFGGPKREIEMNPPESFPTREAYARALTHEFAHSTMDEGSRMSRPQAYAKWASEHVHPEDINLSAVLEAIMTNGGPRLPKAMEEFTAEAVSYLVGDELGFANPNHSLHYFQNWAAAAQSEISSPARVREAFAYAFKKATDVAQSILNTDKDHAHATARVRSQA